MALGITAVATNDTHSPYVSISVTGLTVGLDYTVTRIDNTGETATVAVRGMDTIEASASTAAGTDYEAPIGRSLKYRITQNAATQDSSNVELSYVTIGDVWIRSVSTPSLSRKVVMSEWPETSYPTQILANAHVLGRANPVVITDAWGTRAASFTFITDNDDGLLDTTWQQIVALLTGGGTLLLQTTGQTRTGQADLYFEVESYSRTRSGPLRGDGLGKNVYRHTIGFIEVDRPATVEESLGLRSYSDVLDEADDTKASDTFTRSGTDTWGTAESSQVWAIDTGTAANFDIVSNKAQITLTSANALHLQFIDIGSTDFDIRVQHRLAVGSTSGAAISAYVVGRRSDVSNYYYARLDVTTGGAIQLGLYKLVAASATAIGALTQVGTGHASNDIWHIRLKADGTSIKTYAWKDGTSEPTTFLHDVTDSALTSGTKMGLGGIRQTGNTNTNPVMDYDSLTVTDSASYQDIINNYSSYLTLLTTSYPPGG